MPLLKRDETRRPSETHLSRSLPGVNGIGEAEPRPLRRAGPAALFVAEDAEQALRARLGGGGEAAQP